MPPHRPVDGLATTRPDADGTDHIGGALYEEIVYSPEGQPLTTTFIDYLLPTASEIPPFETLHMTTTADHIPGGFKGMGEAGTIGAASAIVAAVEHAVEDLGVRLTRLPVTPPRLLTAIESGTPTEELS